MTTLVVLSLLKFGCFPKLTRKGSPAMHLKPIDKDRYRAHLRRIITGLVISFISLSVVFSSSLIALFQRAPGENMDLNMVGVAIAFGCCFYVVQRLKSHPYFYEFAYVLDLKHELNLIQRKIRAIKKAAASDDMNALIILLFSYEGSKQLWQLDDNVLHLEQLEQDLVMLEAQLAEKNLQLTASQYSRELLAQF
jgi:hypothetical protein